MRKAIIAYICLFVMAASAAYAIDVQHLGDKQHLVRFNADSTYLLVPVEDIANDASFEIIRDNRSCALINIRLSVNKIDYYVPIPLSEYEGESVCIIIRNADNNAIGFKHLQKSDRFDTTNTEKFRPSGHFSPLYGWMNDPNGMVYLNDEYHLFFQHNPFGSTWGNMHWGHAVSKDLIHWEQLPTALAPDALGAIFSGNCIVKQDTLFAFYTSAGSRQTQSMAYSTDNGRTFTKYSDNPVITADIPDFRDPKLFFHNESGKWIMVLASGQEMRFYSSKNLRQWQYESSFGNSYGNHKGVWECPDLVKLPVDDSKNEKWVLLCNINPGGPFGGSATQYFTGTFDGKKFTCESSPETVKWMDYGKDHYATVSFSNMPNNRHLVMAWMSNWQYAAQVPTKQFRSANSLPRDIKLFTYENETYLQSAATPECTQAKLPHLDIQIHNKNAKSVEIKLSNAQNEYLLITYDFTNKNVSIDRHNSGITNFSEQFPAVCTAPLLSDSKCQDLQLWLSEASVEAFGNNGRWVMTNLVFPESVYNKLTYTVKGGKASVKYKTINLNINTK